MRSPTTNYKGLKFLTVLAFVIVVCVIAVAQNGNEDSKQKEVPATQPINQTTQEQDENSTQKKVPTTLQQRMLKTISVDCINTPIEDVIRMIGEQADVDIIKSPSVTGNVTATLTNVPLIEALNNILAVHGYGCVIDRNMIRIAPIDEIAQKGEILDNRVYRITYADVAEVENALKKFISKRGSISSNPGTSNIIVTDTGSTIKAIDTFIDEIDRITPQVMVEVRIYDVTSTDGFDIGAEWAAGRNTPITDIGNTKTVDKTGSSITEHKVTDVGPTMPVTTTTTTHTVTDDGTGPVTEDKTVTTTTGGGAAGTTIDTTTNTTNTGEASKDSSSETTAGTWLKDSFSKSKPFVGGSFDADAGGTIRLGILDTVDIELTLNILRTQVGAKLLANPRILVLDNETAEFKIISEIPYTEQSQTSAGGSMTSTQFKDVGVELKVKPHVTRDGMIRLDIIPGFSVVSELGSIIPDSGGLRGVPTIDKREVNTKALVKDGQTVVLGGLRKRTVTQTVKKVPVLGDVPILGNLFSDVSEEVKTNELIIFITPKVIIEPVLSPKELKGFEATEFSDPKITDTEAEKAERAKKAEK